MANRTATLYIHISKNGKSPFCKPVYQSKGRLKPQYMQCTCVSNPESDQIELGFDCSLCGEPITTKYAGDIA